jgi:hypothetical protein
MADPQDTPQPKPVVIEVKHCSWYKTTVWRLPHSNTHARLPRRSINTTLATMPDTKEVLPAPVPNAKSGRKQRCRDINCNIAMIGFCISMVLIFGCLFLFRSHEGLIFVFGMVPTWVASLIAHSGLVERRHG